LLPNITLNGYLTLPAALIWRSGSIIYKIFYIFPLLIRPAIRYFNTSGPNFRDEHYTLEREALVAVGMDKVRKSRYFTIWAPRQSGKSTYFRLLAEALEQQGYKVAQFNFENYQKEPYRVFFQTLKEEFAHFFGFSFAKNLTLASMFRQIQGSSEQKLVLIVDEVEGINPEHFGQFLHTIRNAYHSREKHSLKSVIFVGVSNITGVVSDNASPFNISASLQMGYFTRQETIELLEQHEAETGQLFTMEVKEKIYAITADQPGLVNGFGLRLTEQCVSQPVIDYKDYLAAEDWYLYEALDKNISNVINKAKTYQNFLEELLFLDRKIKFDIDKEHIRYFHINGLIKKNTDGNIVFWVPLYKKRLQKYFYPTMNGEAEQIQGDLWLEKYLTPHGTFNLDKIIRDYQAYAKRRGFRYFIQYDEQGKPKGLREAALVYSFETYIQAFLQVFEGKSYLEPHVALGRSDLVVNLHNSEFVVEAKIYSSISQFVQGKNQLAYYANGLGLTKAIYLVFVRKEVKNPNILENKEVIDGVEITTYLVRYDLETDFSEPKR